MTNYERGDTEIDIKEIVVGSRIRKDIGDISGLTDNIKEIGLLHPIVIDEKNHLIAGQRRMSACLKLGWKTIPVRVLNLDDLLHQKAEASENLFRLDLSPAEKELAATALIERIERPAAEERQREGRKGQGGRGKEGGRGKKKPFSQTLAKGFPTREQHARRADDRAGKAVGLSRTTLRKIKEIREAAEEEPEHFQPFYEALQEKGAKVEKVYAKYRREKARIEVPPDAPAVYTEDKAVIYAKDFLKVDPSEIPLGSVNLIVTSPPYNLDKTYGSTSDTLTPEQYEAFTLAWLEKAKTLLAPDGRLCLNVPLDIGYHDADFPAYAEAVRLAIKAGLHYRFSIVWDKGQSAHRTAWGSYQSARAPHYHPAVEMIAVFHVGEWRRLDSGDSDITAAEFQEWTCGPWTFPGESPSRVGGHPAPFPEELPMRCIKLLSYIGDTVLDPFAGSGTTVVVANRLRRKGIGVEIDLPSARFAIQRLTQKI